MNEMRKLMEVVEGRFDREYKEYGRSDELNELDELATKLELAYESFYAKASEENPEFAEVMNNAAGEVFNQIYKILEYR